MSATWNGGAPPAAPKITLRGWLRVLRRGLPMALIIFGGAGLLVIMRLIERPVFGLYRPVTPYLVRAASAAALRCLGLTRRHTGTPMAEQGAVVANHSSWLDIFVLNAGDRVYFVSKDDVAGWPGIGWLAKIVGTVFIARDPRQAKAQAALMQQRLQAGHRLLFFPEGTSTDNQRVLPFKSSLFAAFQADGLRQSIFLQPVSVVYTAPGGADARYYGWWGGMDFAPNLIMLLATSRHGKVHVTYHPPVRVADFADRKALATACQQAVRGGFDARRRIDGAASGAQRCTDP